VNDNELLKTRRQYTDNLVDQFRELITTKHLIGKEQTEVLGNHTCLYAVGSVGRREMSRHSDLDLFLVRLGTKPANRIDAVLLQSAIIRTQRELKLPEPSRDAEFLKIHSATALIERLGQPEDDVENTFTTRMLMLLESVPLLNEPVYDQVIRDTLARYWTDSERHEHDYIPFCLTNDIVRYWRSVLLNYENTTASKRRELEQQRKDEALPSERYNTAKGLLVGDRWLRSYKLKFARALTCYGTIAWFLAHERKHESVTQDMVFELTKLAPLDRLRAAANLEPQAAGPLFLELENAYIKFLDETAFDKQSLRERFCDSTFTGERLAAAEAFGNGLFKLITEIGRECRLYRYLVI
jgi:hypothetical protein